MIITEYNIPVDQVNFVNKLKKELKDFFTITNKEIDGEICIIADYPLLFNEIGRLNLLILISIPFIKGQKNWFKVNNKYLNTLAIGVRYIKDDNISEIDEQYYYSGDGVLDYKKQLINESQKFNKALMELCNIDWITVQFMDWVSSTNLPHQYKGAYAYGNCRPSIKNLISNICSRIKSEKINCYKNEIDNSATKITSILLDLANKQNKIGIILKNKIDRITKENNSNYYNSIKESVEKALTIIEGPAGSGKTQLLTQLVYDYVERESHHVRLLTYNQMLVKDIRMQLSSVLNTKARSVSISTVDKYLYDLCKDTIKQISSKNVRRLEETCEKRIEKAKKIIEKFNGDFGTNENEILSFIDKYATEFDIKNTDREEIINYIKTPSDKRGEYLERQRKWIERIENNNVYIKQKYYVLFKYYKDTLKGNVDGKELCEFIEEANKRDFFLEYKTDCETIVSPKAKWSKIICIDEAQDLHILEKLILFNLRSNNENNLVVALSGKDQIVRNLQETNWTSMNGKPIKYTKVTLPPKTYRQKENIVSFINAFCDKVGIRSGLTTNVKGGKVILDIGHCAEEYPIKLKEFKNFGKGCGCSNYESVICLIPASDDYIEYGDIIEDYIVNDTETIHKIQKYNNKNLKHKDTLCNIFEHYYDGVCYDKDNLISQQHTRIIHYESCRGLEAWTIGCLNLDDYFDHKSNGQGAKEYALSNADIFSLPQTLREQYAYKMCVLAFTRAIDTLYIKIKNPHNQFSKLLIDICQTINSVEIIK